MGSVHLSSYVRRDRLLDDIYALARDSLDPVLIFSPPEATTVYNGPLVGNGATNIIRFQQDVTLNQLSSLYPSSTWQGALSYLPSENAIFVAQPSGWRRLLWADENAENPSFTLTSNTALVSSPSGTAVISSNVSTSELNALSGIDGNIQELLDLKADVLHEHVITDVAGLRSELDGLMNAFIESATGNATINVQYSNVVTGDFSVLGSITARRDGVQELVVVASELEELWTEIQSIPNINAIPNTTTIQANIHSSILASQVATLQSFIGNGVILGDLTVLGNLKALRDGTPANVVLEPDLTQLATLIPNASTIQANVGLSSSFVSLQAQVSALQASVESGGGGSSNVLNLQAQVAALSTIMPNASTIQANVGLASSFVSLQAQVSALQASVESGGGGSSNVSNLQAQIVSLQANAFSGTIYSDLVVYGNILSRGEITAFSELTPSNLSVQPPLTLADFNALQAQVSLLTASSTGTSTGALLVPSGSAPAPGLAFLGNASTGLFCPSVGNVGVSAGGAEKMRVTSAGRVGIGVDPSYALHVNGTIFSSGEIVAFSDARVKGDLLRIDGALDRISALNGYTYVRTDETPQSERRYAGLIAQEVQKVLPEVVHVNDRDETLAVAYGSLMALVIEGFKEMRAELVALQAHYSTLQQRGA